MPCAPRGAVDIILFAKFKARIGEVFFAGFCNKFRKPDELELSYAPSNIFRIIGITRYCGWDRVSWKDVVMKISKTKKAATPSEMAAAITFFIDV